MTVRTTAFAMLLLLSTASDTFAYCSSPDAPSCVSDYGNFDDQTAFDDCKSEVERYQSEIEDFQQCKKREVDEANDLATTAASEAEDVARRARNEIEEAVSNYNDAVRNFNQRAGG